MTNRRKIILSAFFLALLFIIATYFSHVYKDSLIALVGTKNTAGFFIYIALMILGTVFAPLSTVPFMPIAVSIWGEVTTALLSIAGWSLGALIAFSISRRYGLPIAERFVSKDILLRINEKIPEHNHLLLTIILLRMILPVDILSYALGLFPRVTWRQYTIGSIIGVIPFSFVFAYLGGLSIKFQVLGILLISPILLYLYTRKRPVFLK